MERTKMHVYEDFIFNKMLNRFVISMMWLHLCTHFLFYFFICVINTDHILLTIIKFAALNFIHSSVQKLKFENLSIHFV